MEPESADIAGIRRKKKQDAYLRLWTNPDFQLWVENELYSRAQWHQNRALANDQSTEQGRRKTEHEIVAAKAVKDVVDGDYGIRSLFRQVTANDKQFEAFEKEKHRKEDAVL